MMTSSEAPFSVLPLAPPTLNPPLCPHHDRTHAIQAGRSIKSRDLVSGEHVPSTLWQGGTLLSP